MGDVVSISRQSEDPEHDVIAAGPITKAHDGLRAFRVVLRDLSDGIYPKFCTHKEYFNSDGSHGGYAHGNYFERGHGHSLRTAGDVLSEAMADFLNRVGSDMREYVVSANLQGNLRRVSTK